MTKKNESTPSTEDAVKKAKIVTYAEDWIGVQPSPYIRRAAEKTEAKEEVKPFVSPYEQIKQTAEEKSKEASNIFLAIYGEIINYSNIEPYYYHKIASNLDHADATFTLGRMYFNNQVSYEERKEAFYWYEQAAKQGSVEALFNMGCMFYYDEGQSRWYWHNCRENAFKCFQEAAEKGHAVAQFRIGYMYYKGRDDSWPSKCQWVDRDYEEATHWFEKAIESMKNF